MYLFRMDKKNEMFIVMNNKDQAENNNRAIDRSWGVSPHGPNVVFSKKQVLNHYNKSFSRLNKESVYGTVFRVSEKQATAFLQSMNGSSKTIYSPMFDKYYALKIIHKRRNMDWKAFSVVVQREANIQMMVHTSFPEVTPPVCFGGLNHQNGTGYICSPWVAGLQALSKKYSPAMYPDIDNMFSKVWFLGVLHMDAHHNNIFITPDKKFMLLDWGAAAFVPLGLVEDLRHRLHNRSSATPLPAVWQEFVADHPRHNIEGRLYNQVVYRAGAPHLRKTNADWLILSNLYKYYNKTTKLKTKKRKRPNNNTPLQKKKSRLGL